MAVSTVKNRVLQETVKGQDSTEIKREDLFQDMQFDLGPQ